MTAFASMTIPDDETLVRAATEALTHPADSWFSDGDLFVTHGLTIGRTRDSDLMDISNFERISEDMTAAFPGDVYITHASHWAFGWADQLTVRVIRDADDDITPDNITAAFMAITSIADGLRCDYPLYDDYDYYQREYEASNEAFTEVWGDMSLQWDTDTDGPEPQGSGSADMEYAWEAWRDVQAEYGPDAGLTPDELKTAIKNAREG